METSAHGHLRGSCHHSPTRLIVLWGAAIVILDRWRSPAIHVERCSKLPVCWMATTSAVEPSKRAINGLCSFKEVMYYTSTRLFSSSLLERYPSFARSSLDDYALSPSPAPRRSVIIV